MQLCDYGCGQEAQYQFKNGKWCCSKSFRSCPIYLNKNSIQKKKEWNDVNSKFNSILFRKKLSNGIKKSHKDPTSGFNSLSCKEKQSKKIKEIWKDPNSIYNSILWRLEQSNIIKELRKDPNSIYNSIEYKVSKKLNIEKINKKYPFFSKIEEMRYNPDELNEKEIQVHCKNHNCPNSKEKGGWFTPMSMQIYERMRALERPYGMIENNFYCSQKCKDSCSLFRLRSDPFKNTELPYTYQENQLWRQIVLELDKGVCQYCGKPATDVHHIKPVKTHPHLALDPDNGISFCEECHYKIGHKAGTECSTGNLAHKQQRCSLGGV